LSVNHPIKLALLWHMHQPVYFDPHGGVSLAPWVRLHALKDYLDMLLMATKHENVKVTFNLVPSLIEQLEYYSNGGSDRHLELTKMNAAEADLRFHQEICDNSFKCNPETMIKPYPRYYRLFLRWQNSRKENEPVGLTENELRDIQVWSNLTWVDPMFRFEKQIKSLFEKGEDFTEQDKFELLDWQVKHIRKIIPAYKELALEGRIEIALSPYFHPILPLLCDSESAKEAVPDIRLPQQRFQHPEDAKKQIEMALTMSENIFGKKVQGMWPSEGSISEETVRLFAETGVKWIASDEEVLYRSLHKSGMDPGTNPPYAVYEHSSGAKLFFRDHLLSDKISFVYSNWDPDRAVTDFLSHIQKIGERLTNELEDAVLPVILDGENAWEFYRNDGYIFLTELYSRISNSPDIKTVTISEAANQVRIKSLKSIFAGSWINHNFRIWIGHDEDNTAWDYLSSAREFLVTFEKNNPGYDATRIALAWRHIYIAEGSDWCWWYGDEHRGPDNHLFDLLFRSNLMKVYEELDSEIPEQLRLPIITQKYKPAILLPDALVTPIIDGKISHFYEWFGAGKFQCVASETTMHRVYRLLSSIHFAFDHDSFYVRLDFTNHKVLESVGRLQIGLGIHVPEEKRIDLIIPKVPFNSTKQGIYSCALSEVLEIAVARKFLWTGGFGPLAFKVEIYDQKQLIEMWPEEEPIVCELPEKNKELFWHQ